MLGHSKIIKYNWNWDSINKNFVTDLKTFCSIVFYNHN